MPWSHGCNTLVVFGGKKISSTFEVCGWAVQLSKMSVTFLLSMENLLLIFCNHAAKISDVIHAFLFAVYSTGNGFSFLKYLGFLDFLMTSKGSFSDPSALQPTFFELSFLSGRHRKNSPNSSQLNMSHSAYFCKIPFLCHVWLHILEFPAQFFVLNTMTFFWNDPAMQDSV